MQKTPKNSHIPLEKMKKIAFFFSFDEIFTIIFNTSITITSCENIMDEDKKSIKQKKHKISIRKKIVVIVLVFFGVLLIASGGSVLYYNLSTDAEGYAYSNVYHVNTPAYAFTAYMNEYKISTWSFLGASNIADIKYIVKPTDSTKEIFMGYATTTASQTYLDSFMIELPTYWTWWAEPYYAEIDINTTLISGSGAPIELPQEQTFWLTSAQSSGVVTMNYLPQNEQHVWVIMNSDGSSDISADIQIAFKSPILTILPQILIGIGLILIVLGIYILKRRKKIT